MVELDVGMAPPLLTRRQFWLVFACLTPVAALLAALSVWPIWRTDGRLAVAITVLVTAFFAVGVVLLAEPAQFANAMSMMATAVLLVVSWSNEWNLGPLPFLSGFAGGFWILTAGWALYRYPEHRLTRGDRLLFWVLVIWFTTSSLAEDVLSVPQWHGFSAGSWWPTLVPRESLFHFVAHVVRVVALALLILYIVLWLRKISTSRPAIRRVKLPMAIAGVIAAVLALAVEFGRDRHVPEPVMNLLYALSAMGALAVPLAFLIVVLRRFLGYSAVAELVVELRRTPSPDSVLAGLRQTLRDPGAQVAYWSPDEGEYYCAGAPVGSDWARGTDLTVTVPTSEGAPLAMIRVDEIAATDPDRVNATVAAFALALENSALLATVQDQLGRLRGVSVRLVQATDAERQRIGRNLHDGAQGRFVALGPRIGALEARTRDPDTARALGEVRRELEIALAELRELAHGLDPSVARLGLARALREQTRGHSFELSIHLPQQDPPQTVSLTAYYAICEAVANTAKHAQARRMEINGSMQNDVFQITITDDGRGGATVGKGRGLGGIVDRVAALGGTSRVISPPGAGTRLELRIPCE